MAIKCGSCHGTHESAAEVRRCFKQALPKRSASPISGLGPTPNQRSFIESLMAEHDFRLEKPLDEMTVNECSVLIEDLKRSPRKQSGVTDGMYVTPDGTIFKVQYAVHGSGRLYAKRLIPPEAFGEKATFTYEPGAIHRLKPEMKMTIEQAKQFGALYGTCVRCGRTLTREDSIERMMGPVCFGKEFG